MAIRVGNRKVSFKEQYSELVPYLPLGAWQAQFTSLRGPNLYNLRADPYERGPESRKYPDWYVARIFLIVPAQAIAAQWLESLKEFPFRQKPASFNLEEVLKKMEDAS